jgi:YHS domain-containing protein
VYERPAGRTPPAVLIFEFADAPAYAARRRRRSVGQEVGMYSLRVALVVLAALIVAGCGTVANVSTDGADRSLMLRGNDPVAYFARQAAVAGDPAIRAEHAGLTYRFASAEHRAQFLRDPDRYLPSYAGFCASGAPYALKAAIGADVFAIVEGRLFVFGSDRSRRNWLMDWRDNVRTGDRYWAEETRDVPYRWQNLKRYVFKVPGYRTDDELDAEFSRRQREGTLPAEALPYVPR